MKDTAPSDLDVFEKVARMRSLTGAGAELGLTPAVVSKRLQRLEKRLGARLFHRTTRRVVPTEIGQAFHERIAPLVAALGEAEAQVLDRSMEARGLLRVTAPTSFGRLHVVPQLPAFFAAHPDIRLDLDLTDSFVDMAAEGYDVGVRIGELPSSGLIAKRLAPVRRVLCASPDYLTRMGTPDRLDDLGGHVCLSTRNQSPWRLDGPDGRRTVRVSGPLTTSSNEVVREAVIAGLGIALRSTWDIAGELREAKLSVVLPAYTASTGVGIYAVHPSREFVPAKTKAFIAFLARLCRNRADWR